MYCLSPAPCRLTTVRSSVTRAALGLLLVTMGLVAEPTFAEDCVSATLQDVTSGGAAAMAVEVLYLDATAGGIGGDIKFIMPHSVTVDQVEISGSDGFSTTIPASGTETTLQISTQGDSSPSTASSTITYTVVYKILGMGGAACTLTATWAEPSCVVIATPDPPTEGLAWMVDVHAENVLHDSMNSRFGTLSSTASGLPAPVSLLSPNVLGVELRFLGVHQVANYSAANDAGTYTAAIAGPGGQAAQCSWPLAVPVTWQEVGDAGDHLNPQTTGSQGAPPASLVAIEGALDASDSLDVYCININDPAMFRATTSSLEDPSASAMWDTRLFLIAPGGAALAVNDDSPSGGTGSLITAVGAFPGGIASMPLITRGEVLLAINAFPDAPFDAGGNPIFEFLNATDLGGPEIAGTKVALWTAGSSFRETYVIALQGAEPCVDVPIFSDGFEFGSTATWQ